MPLADARFTLLRLALLAFLLAFAVLNPDPSAAQPPSDIRRDVCVLKLPLMDQVRADTGQVFSTAGGRTLKFALYKPLPAARRGTAAPVVVFVNGVGAIGAPLREWGIYRSWAQLVAVSGMAAVTHDSRAESAREDLAALVAHLRAHAGGLGIDGDNIAIWACSANLRPGSAYALDPANTWVKAAVFYYGAVDTIHTRPDLPVLVGRAGLDNSFTNGSLTQFIQRSIAANGAVTVLNLPNARHAFDLIDDIETSRDAVRTTLAFLKANLTREVQEARTVRADDTRSVRLHAARNWEGVLAATASWAGREPENGQPRHLAADAQYQLRRYREAADLYEKAGSLHWMPAITYYNAACSWALAGEKDRALTALERSFATGFRQNLAAVLQDPDLASLREEPRFRKLVTP